MLVRVVDDSLLPVDQIIGLSLSWFLTELQEKPWFGHCFESRGWVCHLLFQAIALSLTSEVCSTQLIYLTELVEANSKARIVHHFCMSRYIFILFSMKPMVYLLTKYVDLTLSYGGMRFQVLIHSLYLALLQQYIHILLASTSFSPKVDL